MLDSVYRYKIKRDEKTPQNNLRGFLRCDSIQLIRSIKSVRPAKLHHAVHATHATHTAHAAHTTAGWLFFSEFGNHAIGCQHQ